jgi:D-3-phosphoglycerate dehydrogenase
MISTTDGPEDWLKDRFAANFIEFGQAPKKQIEILLVHQTRVDALFLDSLPHLKGIIRLGVGYDKVDLQACQDRKVSVTNIPGYCTEEVAMSSIAFALDWARGNSELESKLATNPARWQKHSVSRLKGFSDLTFGVIGAGRIGARTLSIAQSLSFKTSYFDPHVDDLLETQKMLSLDALLKASDIVSLHVPLNDETSGMITDSFIQSMRPQSLLINTARGGLLGNVNALIQGLEDHHLSSACFDVLPDERDVEGSILFQKWKKGTFQGRLRITPHNAFFSQASQMKLMIDAAFEVDCFLKYGRFNQAII